MKRPVVQVAIVAALGLFCYSNTFYVPFQWDEIQRIQENPIVKDIDYFWNPSSAQEFKRLYNAVRTRYIGYLTFAFNYRINGLDVMGYHVVNTAIHLINAVLVYLFVLLTFNTPALRGSRLKEHSGIVGLISALIFVCHPIQTEAVTYIFQRLASLVAMFYMLSITSYAASRLAERKTTGYPLYAVSLLSCVLAMKTKENAFTLPLVIMLYEFLFFKRESLGKMVLRLVPFMVTMIIIPLSMTGLEGTAGQIIGNIGSASRGHAEIERAEYLFTQFSVVVTYLRLLLFPVGQSIAHEYPIYTSFFTPPVLISVLFLLGIFSFGVYSLYRSRIADNTLRITAFGVFFFFITHSVESSVIPIPMVINEYRLYLPSVGFYMTVVTSVCLLLPRLKMARKALTILLVILVMLYAGATYARNNVWRTKTSLWEDTVIKSPHAAFAHFNLASAYRGKGMDEKALEHYRTVVRLDPLYVEAYYALGVIHYSLGRTGRAIKDYLTALRLNPYYAEPHNNLGAIYNERGMYQEAIRHLKDALKSKPEYPEAHFNIGVSYGLLNMTENAIDHLEKAVQINPGYVKAHINLGIAYASKGMYGMAEAHFLSSLRLDPENTKAKELLDMLYETEFGEPMGQASE
jgi:tetratricopeptide (TPR) repeat protein